MKNVGGFLAEVRNLVTPPAVSSIEELEALLREGEESGEPIAMTASEWQRLRDDAEKDATLRRKAS